MTESSRPEIVDWLKASSSSASFCSSAPSASAFVALVSMLRLKLSLLGRVGSVPAESAGVLKLSLGGRFGSVVSAATPAATATADGRSSRLSRKSVAWTTTAGEAVATGAVAGSRVSGNGMDWGNSAVVEVSGGFAGAALSSSGSAAFSVPMSARSEGKTTTALNSETPITKTKTVKKYLRT